MTEGLESKVDGFRLFVLGRSNARSSSLNPRSNCLRHP